MKSIRMMNQPEDYQKLGVNPNKIEPWEDGRRNVGKAGCIEWWYLDADTDDGIKIGLNFSTKVPVLQSLEGYKPFVYYNIQFPDGTVATNMMTIPDKESNFKEGNCDVQCGNNYFRGDLTDYSVHIEDPQKQFTIDLSLHREISSWRPGSAFAQRSDGQTFTWLCAVPKGEVNGFLRYQDKKLSFHGQGYHDHQWATDVNYTFWNRWLWARQQTNDYTVLLFDLVSTQATGAQQFPWFFVHDKDGNVIFDNIEKTADVDIEIESTREDKGSGKVFPQLSRYTFRKNNLEASYILNAKEDFVFNNHYQLAPESIKKEYDKLGCYPTYTRTSADAHFILKENGETLVDFSGEMLYEISSMWSNYILDAADKENIQKVDPLALAAKLRTPNNKHS